MPGTADRRQRLDGARGSFDSVIKEANAGLLSMVEITAIKTELGEYVPMDMDVSPFDNSKTHKEAVGRTYKGMDGYAPNFAYIGAEGYMLNCELPACAGHGRQATWDTTLPERDAGIFT